MYGPVRTVGLAEPIRSAANRSLASTVFVEKSGVSAVTWLNPPGDHASCGVPALSDCRHCSAIGSRQESAKVENGLMLTAIKLLHTAIWGVGRSPATCQVLSLIQLQFLVR